jgi:hypothetical protein
MVKFFELVSDKIDKVYDYAGDYYLYIIFWFHLIYFSVIFGIMTLDIHLLNSFNIFIHTMVCVFLILRFNPLREKNRLRENDSRIIYSSSLFLLLNMGVVEIIRKFFPVYSQRIDDVKVLL